MVDGFITVEDHEKTESNRSFVQSFIEEVLIKRELHLLDKYVHCEKFTEYNPVMIDGITALNLELSSMLQNGNFKIVYSHTHRILTEGNFVLSVCEGLFNGIHSSYYDLFRLDNQKIVEHWDTREVVPARELWKNDNGKF